MRPQRTIEAGLPEDGVHEQQKRRCRARPSRKHFPAKQISGGQTKSADKDGDDGKRAFSIVKHNIHDAAEEYEERITGRLGLMNAGIELLEREGQIDVVDRQIGRHYRDSGQQQQRDNDDPENFIVLPLFHKWLQSARDYHKPPRTRRYSP
jgi:hypothetical protein